MFGKNLYLSVAIFMMFLLAIIFFQNAADGGSYVVFLFSTWTMTQYIWPVSIIAGVMGAAITLYIQKLMEDMDVDQQSGWLNI